MPNPLLSEAELAEIRAWRAKIVEVSRNNIWCHCKQCDREWIASGFVACTCGSTHVERVLCWQFPDD